MACRGVRVERTVRLGRGVEGFDSTAACIFDVALHVSIRALLALLEIEVEEIDPRIVLEPTIDVERCWISQVKLRTIGLRCELIDAEGSGLPSRQAGYRLGECIAETPTVPL